MSKIKFSLFFAVIFIFFIFGCESSNNNVLPDNYGDILQSAAYVGSNGSNDSNDSADFTGTTDIISGTISFTSGTSVPAAEKTEPQTTDAEIPESAEPTETKELTELTELTEPPETSEFLESPALYVITPSGKKYHYPACRTVKTIKQYISKEEAERLGYEACKICKPE